MPESTLTEEIIIKTPKSIYNGEIVAGSLMIPESRQVAKLLLAEADEAAWFKAIYEDNILQKRSPATAKRQSRLIRNRLSLMQPELWELVIEGSAEVASHSLLAVSIKHSRLLGDFMVQVCREHWKTFNPKLNTTDWRVYLESCTQIEPAIADWSESTTTKLRQVVFRILAESSFLNNTRSLELHAVQIVPEVIRYLKNNNEDYVLRCMEITR